MRTRCLNKVSAPDVLSNEDFDPAQVEENMRMKPAYTKRDEESEDTSLRLRQAIQMLLEYILAKKEHVSADGLTEHLDEPLDSPVEDELLNIQCNELAENMKLHKGSHQATVAP